MTALVLVGLLAIAIGGLTCLRVGQLATGFVTQAAGALVLGAAGLWALVSGDIWGAPFTTEASGDVVNQVRIKIANRTGEDREYTIAYVDEPGAKLIAPGAQHVLPLLELEALSRLTVALQDRVAGDVLLEMHVRELSLRSRRRRLLGAKTTLDVGERRLRRCDQGG